MKKRCWPWPHKLATQPNPRREDSSVVPRAESTRELENRLKYVLRRCSPWTKSLAKLIPMPKKEAKCAD